MMNARCEVDQYMPGNLGSAGAVLDCMTVGEENTEMVRFPGKVAVLDTDSDKSCSRVHLVLAGVLLHVSQRKVILG